MNDRFKFRVWDTNIKEYLVGEFLVGGCGDMIHNVVDYESFLNKGNYIIEQCTGLKDKNGNLIYEGDIIHEVDKEAEIDDFSQIVWSQGTCHFMKLDLPETGLDRHCLLCEEDSPYIEIIRNIHEQPEQKE